MSAPVILSGLATSDVQLSTQQKCTEPRKKAHNNDQGHQRVNNVHTPRQLACFHLLISVHKSTTLYRKPQYRGLQITCPVAKCICRAQINIVVFNAFSKINLIKCPHFDFFLNCGTILAESSVCNTLCEEDQTAGPNICKPSAPSN